MKLVIISLAACACGVLYRMGGSSKYSKLWRRIGCSALVSSALLYLGYNHLLVLAHSVLLYLALTTYNDWLAPDGTSENWLCWLVTGLFYGLAALPLGWDGVLWRVLLRSAVLGVLTMGWSEWISNDVQEEFGRGFLLGLSCGILV